MIKIADDLFIENQLNIHSVDRDLLKEIFNESIDAASAFLEEQREEFELSDKDISETLLSINSPENKELFIQKFDGKDLNCMSKFINSELDFVTKSDRGLGRDMAIIPRLGALFRKHEYINTEDFRSTLVRLFVTGYLIGLIMLKEKKENNFDEQVLYEKWIPQIYRYYATTIKDLQIYSILILYKRYNPLIEALSSRTRITENKIAEVIWGIATAGVVLSTAKYWDYE